MEVDDVGIVRLYGIKVRIKLISYIKSLNLIVINVTYLRFKVDRNVSLKFCTQFHNCLIEYISINHIYSKRRKLHIFALIIWISFAFCFLSLIFILSNP